MTHIKISVKKSEATSVKKKNMFEQSELFFFRRRVYFLAEFYVGLIFLLRFFILGKNEEASLNTPLLVFDSLPLLIEGTLGSVLEPKTILSS